MSRQTCQITPEGTPVSQGTNFPNEHLKLPRVTLPTFSGKYEQWIPFRNMFLSMIHENPVLPNVQKMQSDVGIDE